MVISNQSCHFLLRLDRSTGICDSVHAQTAKYAAVLLWCLLVMNPCDISPKWIIQRGNQPTKIKEAQQRNKNLLMWQVVFKLNVDGAGGKR